MASLFILGVLYFLPAILGRDKSNATGIFLLNFFLGWTLIGWVAAFIWAISSDRPVYARLVPAGQLPAGHALYCSRCGAIEPVGAHYCAACGRTL
jgi:hypothetical protein